MATPKLIRSRYIVPPVQTVPASRQIAPGYMPPPVHGPYRPAPPKPRGFGAFFKNVTDRIRRPTPIVVGGNRPVVALSRKRRSGNKPGVYYRRDKFGQMHRIESKRPYTKHDTVYWSGRRARRFGR